MLVPNRAKSLALWLIAVAGCASAEHGDPDAPLPASITAPDKGPAHELPLPSMRDVPGAWRYVAPEEHGRSLYDASYFDGRWFVLHGTTVNSEKLVVSEMNWLSWTRDGMAWETVTLTSAPYGSYTKLASNGKSLLLAGIHGIAKLEGDKAVDIQALNQSVYPPVILPYPDGYALARIDDVVWLSNDGKVEVLMNRRLAQFRAGVSRTPPARSLIIGPFAAYGSGDGKHWDEAQGFACTGCSVAYGNGRYLAADTEAFYVSSDGAAWEGVAGPSMERVSNIDFTGGNFLAFSGAGNIRLSPDGSKWSDQLNIAGDEAGPAACDGRCIVAGGRILLPPKP